MARFIVDGWTLVVVVMAAQFYGALLMAVCFREWFWVAWMGVPFVPLAVGAFWFLLPARSPRYQVDDGGWP